VLLVPLECVHLELKQVYVRSLRHVVSSSALFTLSPLPLDTYSLYYRLVVLADVDMSGVLVQGKLQVPLSHSLLDSLAVGGVPSWFGATPSAVNQTTRLLSNS